MALNMQALEQAQKELAAKGGSKGWIQLSKIEKPIDVRIQDPLPAMNGIYYVEVPVWWVNNVKIISPKLLGPAEHDIVKTMIDEAKSAKDPDILALLNAKSATGSAKISYKPEYWIPVLKFNWELDSQNNIKGIKNEKGEYSTDLIKKFIEDGKWKFLVVGIMALKAINEIATKRGGNLMVDQAKGFNLILSKSGKDRETKYSAVRDSDIIPMPPELYTEEARVDPFLVAQSAIYTDDYMAAVLGKYLYNDVEIPEKNDNNYAYPELRAELKSKISEEEVEEAPKASARKRPGSSAPETTKVEALVQARGRGAVNPPPAELLRSAPATAGRPAAARTAGRPAGRPGRNVAEDLKEV